MTTDYDIFQKIKTHLLTQKHRSKLSYGSDSCAYRGISEAEMDKIYINYPNTDMDEDAYITVEELIQELPYESSCAVGCIIKDKFYKYELEENAANEPEVLVAVIESNPEWNLTGNSVHMMMLLQRIHDVRDTNTWEESFNELENCFLDGSFNTEKMQHFVILNEKFNDSLTRYTEDTKVTELYLSKIEKAKKIIKINNS
jgi:hypothetical protein